MSFTRRGFIGTVLGAIGLSTIKPEAPKREPKVLGILNSTPCAITLMMAYRGEKSIGDLVYITEQGKATTIPNGTPPIGYIVEINRCDNLVCIALI